MNLNCKNIWIVKSIFLLYFSFVSAQSSDRLTFLREQISQTEELLRKTNLEKTGFIAQINARQSLIRSRQELILSLQNEIKQLESKLLQLESQHADQWIKFNLLKKDFSMVARQKYLTKLSHYDFTLSDPLEHESQIKRLIWKDQLNRSRVKSFLNYKKSLDSVLYQKKAMVTAISSKKEVLQSISEERNKLESDFKNLQLNYSDLKTRQKDYIQQIKKFNEEQNQLRTLVNSSIPNKNSNELLTTHKSNYRWKFPLKRGTIISVFGVQQDPRNKQLKIKNNGIDIRSTESFVSAVSDAEVIQIKQLPNGSFFLLTKVDNHYQVYSNLDKVLVRMGEQIHQGNNIGELVSKSNSNYELHFEIWEGKMPVDPMVYLNR